VLRILGVQAKKYSSTPVNTDRHHQTSCFGRRNTADRCSLAFFASGPLAAVMQLPRRCPIRVSWASRSKWVRWRPRSRLV